MPPDPQIRGEILSSKRTTWASRSLPTSVSRVTDAECGAPYYVVLDVAIHDVGRYRDEVSSGRVIRVEGLPPDQPATDAPRPRAVAGLTTP
jgi:hypothetical protein